MRTQWVPGQLCQLVFDNKEKGWLQAWLESQSLHPFACGVRITLGKQA